MGRVGGKEASHWVNVVTESNTQLQSKHNSLEELRETKPRLCTPLKSPTHP